MAHEKQSAFENLGRGGGAAVPHPCPTLDYKGDLTDGWKDGELTDAIQMASGFGRLRTDTTNRCSEMGKLLSELGQRSYFCYFFTKSIWLKK